MLGQTRVDTAIDFGIGHGNASALEIKRFPAMFKSLPPLYLSCQPAADAMADKIKAMLEFGMDNTRVKDLFDIAARIRNGTFDEDAVAEALAQRDVELGQAPACLSAAYAERHQTTWESWLAKSRLKDSRSLSDVVSEIRRPVEAVLRKAVRLRDRAQQPALRLVSSR
jgi:hypothetical protein